MEIESPLAPSSQVSSHGRVQTLPHTAGNGFASRTMSIASSNFLFAIRLTYAFTLTPAGQDSVHLGSPITSTLYSLPLALKTPLFPPSTDSASKILSSLFFDFRRYPPRRLYKRCLKIIMF